MIERIKCNFCIFFLFLKRRRVLPWLRRLFVSRSYMWFWFLWIMISRHQKIKIRYGNWNPFVPFLKRLFRINSTMKHRYVYCNHAYVHTREIRVTILSPMTYNSTYAFSYWVPYVNIVQRFDERFPPSSPVILVHAPLTIAAGLGGSGVFPRPRLLISISLSWRLYLIIFFVLLRTVHPALSTPPSQMSAKYFPLGPSKFMIQINFASVRRFFLRSKPTQVCHCQFRQQVLHWRGWCWSCH